MVTNILSFLVILLLAAWFLLSVFNQNARTRKMIGRIAYRDICSLLPIWTFFAPNPGRTDLYLVYRDRDAEGSVSSWRQVRSTERRSWLSLWSPQRRIQKGIVDLAGNFTKGVVYEARQSVSKQQVVSFPYLLLLNYVCGKPVDFRARTRQFALAKTNGHGTEDEPEVIFLSAFHTIDQLN